MRRCCFRSRCRAAFRRWSAQHWKALLGFSFFEIIAAWFLLSDAERHLTSSMTGLLIAASPIIAAILDRFTGGEQRLGVRRILGSRRRTGRRGRARGSASRRRKRLAGHRGAHGGHLLRHRSADRGPPSRRCACAADDRRVPGIRRPGVCRSRRGDMAVRNALNACACWRWPAWRSSAPPSPSSCSSP